MKSLGAADSNLFLFLEVVNDEYFDVNKIEEGEYEDTYIMEISGTGDVRTCEQFIMKTSSDPNCPRMLSQIRAYTALDINPTGIYSRMQYNGMF